MVGTPERSQPEPSRNWFWVATGLVESAVIVTALVLLVYYAVR
jgi:hypothetical protein